jgi:hypothetical protein
MTPAQVLQDLGAAGLTVAVEGEELSVRGPDAALTSERLAAIRHHKTELLALLRAETTADLAALRQLADSIGARMQSLREVPDGEWRTFRAALLADDDKLAAGMKRLGVTLEQLGWTVAGTGSKWRRVGEVEAHRPAPRETLFDDDDEEAAQSALPGK